MGEVGEIGAWRNVVHRSWEDDVLPGLGDYTRLPCLSPAYDPGWERAGHLVAAAQLLAGWCRGRRVPGLETVVVAPPGRTPALVVDVPAVPSGDAGAPPGTVLVYGHFDKQPPLGDWRTGLAPFEPVRRGDRLYGRGTADDGYAVFAAVTALELLASTGGPRPRTVVLIEGSEESGSPDLAAHLDDLDPRIGRPEAVVCLDSGCLSYDRLWTTASLRGLVVLTLRVQVLEEGVHSGMAGGVVPSSFRLARRLLSRIEDEATGTVLLPELQAEVPAPERRALETVAAEIPGSVSGAVPGVPGLELSGRDEADRLVARAWAPAVAVTGVDGVPPVAEAGNVLRPFTTLKLSVRLPPTVDATRAAAALQAALGSDPPEGAAVSVAVDAAGDGWVAPEAPSWLTEALADASTACFGALPSTYGEGGTIPFLSLLGDRFPGVPLVATGVLGPGSNAHGPNESLHLPMAEAVTVAVASLLRAAASRG